MDIVVNHTADVIHYRECPDGNCPYRSRADYPYQRRGGIDGARSIRAFWVTPSARRPISRTSRPDYAYTPVIDPGEEKAKVPGWLNDPLVYHNRGNSTFAGESSTMGDFSGLDDVMTESPG
jgi:glycosidase